MAMVGRHGEWFIEESVKGHGVSEIPAVLEKFRVELVEAVDLVRTSIRMIAIAWSLLDEIGVQREYADPSSKRALLLVWARLHETVANCFSGRIDEHAVSRFQDSLDAGLSSWRFRLDARRIVQGARTYEISGSIVAKGIMRECLETGTVTVFDGCQVQTLEPLTARGGMAAVYVPMALAIAKLRALLTD